MTAEDVVGGSNPFTDPSLASTVQDVVPATLAVGQRASLTLGQDSLVIHDETQQQRERTASNCCGFLPNRDGALDDSIQVIRYHNILWAELAKNEVTIRYAGRASKKAVKPEYINYSVDKQNSDHAEAWVETLLDNAYGKSQRRKRIKVLINPFGGKGSAQKYYHRDIEPIFAAARCEVDVQHTKFQGHAVELIAEHLDTDAWDVVACCSGDGVPHEVFNGLAKKPDAARALSQIAVVQLPCGTGNAMSLNLTGTDSPSLAALGVVKGLRTPLDLVSITQGDRRTLSFLSQSVGIIAESDLATEHLRWMGDARFTYGFLVRLLAKSVWPCDLAVATTIERKSEIKEHYHAEASKPPPSSQERGDIPETGLPPLKFGTVQDPLPNSWEMVPYEKLGNFYAGNMAYMSADTNMFPASLPNDGNMDLVCIDGDIPRRTAISMLLGVEKGTFMDMEQVSYRKVVAYRIVPRGWEEKGRDGGFISIDGERVPYEPFQAECHKGLGTVLSLSGRLYEARGPSRHVE